MSGWRKRTIMEMAREADPKANLSEPYCLDHETKAWLERFAALVRAEALAQPEQEPVGRFAKFTDGIWREVTDGSAGVPLYITPPQRPWVGLTDEEIQELRYKIDSTAHWTYDEFAQAIEAKLKEKNT